MSSIGPRWVSLERHQLFARPARSVFDRYHVVVGGHTFLRLVSPTAKYVAKSKEKKKNETFVLVIHEHLSARTQLFSWGSNQYGELCRLSSPADTSATICGTENGSGLQPVTTLSKETIEDIVVASRRSFIVTANNGLFACGSNDGGMYLSLSLSSPFKLQGEQCYC